MRVYHGATIAIPRPLVNVGRKHLDFGEGFYVTDLPQQAISWAQRPINAGKCHILNTYELDIEGVLSAGYRYKRFFAYDSEWLEFVVANRRGEHLWKEYDIVAGGIANDRVFNTIELYVAGLTLMEIALKKLQYEKPNNQICLLRQSLVDDYLHFVEAKQIEP
jgi:hypothetical protein